MIVSEKEPFGVDHFDSGDSFDNAISHDDDFSSIYEIRFNLIPGYDEDEYNQTTLGLGDGVRKQVNSYFKREKRK